MAILVGLLGAKKHSNRLYGKGWRDFGGKPVFQWNVEKGLKLFDKMYVSSDYDYILDKSSQLGAIPIKRTDPQLLECPNIDYYKWCYQFMEEPDIIVALQVNSPTLDIKAIEKVIKLMEMGCQEVKTCHKDYTDYGSVWAMTKERLFNYEDPYHAKPDAWIVERSIDIHSIKDLNKALCQL